MFKVISAIILSIVGIVAVIMLFGLLMSLPVYWLWNGCLVGLIDGVHDITWLQSWGILVLFGLLFKSSTSKSVS